MADHFIRGEKLRRQQRTRQGSIEDHIKSSLANHPALTLRGTITWLDNERFALQLPEGGGSSPINARIRCDHTVSIAYSNALIQKAAFLKKGQEVEAKCRLDPSAVEVWLGYEDKAGNARCDLAFTATQVCVAKEPTAPKIALDGKLDVEGFEQLLAFQGFVVPAYGMNMNGRGVDRNFTFSSFTRRCTHPQNVVEVELFSETRDDYESGVRSHSCGISVADKPDERKVFLSAVAAMHKDLGAALASVLSKNPSSTDKADTVKAGAFVVTRLRGKLSLSCETETPIKR
jgi:hypothetical protein